MVGHDVIVGIGEVLVEIGKVVPKSVGYARPRIGQRDLTRVVTSIDRHLTAAHHASDELSQEFFVVQIPASVCVVLSTEFVGRKQIKSRFSCARGVRPRATAQARIASLSGA